MTAVLCNFLSVAHSAARHATLLSNELDAGEQEALAKWQNKKQRRIGVHVEYIDSFNIQPEVDEFLILAVILAVHRTVRSLYEL